MLQIFMHYTREGFSTENVWRQNFCKDEISCS